MSFSVDVWHKFKNKTMYMLCAMGLGSLWQLAYAVGQKFQGQKTGLKMVV